MSDIRYDVVVSGLAVEGFELTQVKQEFARLFAVTEAKTERIFTIGNVAIKKGIAQKSAQQFIHKLEQIGVSANLRPSAQGLALVEMEERAESDSSDSDAKLNQSAGIYQQANSFQQAQISQQIEKPIEQEPEKHSDQSSIAQPDQAPASMSDFAMGKHGPAQEDVVAKSLPFIFHGKGSEYFRVWIVNILLTILTLGIYSAWAKVRNAQYFYGNTEVSGSRFAYLASPWSILKGRIIAVVAFVVYSLASHFYPIAGLILSILLFALLPAIVVRSLKFNRRMSAWRNIRFGFDGQVWQASQVFLLWPLAGTLTLGLLMPVALYKQSKFIIENTRYGTARFSLASCGKPYYMIYLSAAVIGLLAALVIGLLAFVLPGLPAITSLISVVVYFYLYAFISVRTTNLIFNNSALNDGDFSFHCNWQEGSYLKLVFFNSLFTLLTLGLYYPWAMVHVAQYKAQHLALNAYPDLDGFVAAEADNVSALGEEFGDVFDMDVGMGI